jgi:transposase
MTAPNRFKPYVPDLTAVLRLDVALPPDHPIHVFVDIIQGISLDHFVVPPGPKGEKPYHPQALFGILAWGYLHGVHSSRNLARLAQQEATFIYLAGGGQPNYRTLARFRRENATAFTAVFEETVILALRLGLARLGHVALDGTKFKANSSKHKAMSYGRMRQREATLKEEIAALVARAETQDAADDQAYATADGYSIAEELRLREARLGKIQAVRERLETEQRQAQGLSDAAVPVIDDKEQRSFADADARIMLMKHGEFDYAYNGQAAVDAEGGVIVAASMTNLAPDTGHLPAMVAKVRALRTVAGKADTDLTTMSADAGYCSAENIAEDGDGIDLLIAAGRTASVASPPSPGQYYTADRFAYDAERDVWYCPAEKVLAREEPPAGARCRPSKHRYVAAATDCAACPFRQHCLKPGEERRVLDAQRRRTTGGMRFKLRDPDARRRYARRKVIVEPIFGQLKADRGFVAVSMRGLIYAKGEYLLACLAHNLGKLLCACALSAVSVAA